MFFPRFGSCRRCAGVNPCLTALSPAAGFALCRALLDEVVLLSEAEIYRAMQALYFEDRLVAEGGAAVGVGALLAGRIAAPGRTATIITGRNVDMAQFTQVVTGHAVTLGDVTVPGQVWR